MRPCCIICWSEDYQLQQKVLGPRCDRQLGALQCRQKTVEVKAKCNSCTLWWCPACLLNRYGEEVAKAGS